MPKGIVRQPTQRTNVRKTKKVFDPEGSGYDYEAAEASGGKPDKRGHWGSLDPRTGMVLKGRKHSTWKLMEDEEIKRGFKITKKKNGRYYSVPVGGK